MPDTAGVSGRSAEATGPGCSYGRVHGASGCCALGPCSHGHRTYGHSRALGSLGVTRCIPGVLPHWCPPDCHLVKAQAVPTFRWTKIPARSRQKPLEGAWCARKRRASVLRTPVVCMKVSDGLCVGRSRAVLAHVRVQGAGGVPTGARSLLRRQWCTRSTRFPSSSPWV